MKTTVSQSEVTSLVTEPWRIAMRFSPQSRKREFAEFKQLAAELRRIIRDPETPRDSYQILKHLYYDEFHNQRALQQLRPSLTTLEWKHLSQVLRARNDGKPSTLYAICTRAYKRGQYDVAQR